MAKARNTMKVAVARSSELDARDKEKVERLAAPDWRSDQPMPSAKYARNPRKGNTEHKEFVAAEKRRANKIFKGKKSGTSSP